MNFFTFYFTVYYSVIFFLVTQTGTPPCLLCMQFGNYMLSNNLWGELLLMSGLGHTHAVYTRAWILLFLGNKRASCYVIFQARGRGDPPWDLQALHPAAVLSGDVHHWDAQICLLAGLPAAPQERWILEKENPLTSPYSLCVGVSMCASLHAACFVSGGFFVLFF